MKNNFNSCLTRLLKDEGGYSNTPGDNGGPTNYGITIADYRKYINKAGTAADVKGMTVDQAKVVYKARYWDALDCDNLASGVDYTCFDYGVNSGVGRPRKALQRFKSLKVLPLIDAINNERTAFLRSLASTQAHDQQFLRGWLSRVERVRAYSKTLAQDNTTGTAVGAGTLGTFALVSQYFHQHEVAILISGFVLAIIAGIAIHFYKKGK